MRLSPGGERRALVVEDLDSQFWFYWGWKWIFSERFCFMLTKECGNATLTTRTGTLLDLQYLEGPKAIEPLTATWRRGTTTSCNSGKSERFLIFCFLVHLIYLALLTVRGMDGLQFAATSTVPTARPYFGKTSCVKRRINALSKSKSKAKEICTIGHVAYETCIPFHLQNAILRFGSVVSSKVPAHLVSLALR